MTIPAKLGLISIKSFTSREAYIKLKVITVFPVFRLLTDFVCLYTYEF